MTRETSIGPAENPPAKGEVRMTQATTEGVDAQNANEFDMQHGLAGAEAKPFAPANRDDEKQARQAEKPSVHEAAASQPADDFNESDPHERTDMIKARRKLDPDSGAGAAGRTSRPRPPAIDVQGPQVPR